MRQLNSENKRLHSFVIGVAGGTASGKTTVCSMIREALGQDDVDNNLKKVVFLSEKSFYRQLNDVERNKAFHGNFNFDHPDAIEFELLKKTLVQLCRGNSVEIPVYDFTEHRRKPEETVTIHSADVILIEGILLFYQAEIRELIDLRLFVDTDSDTRLARRVLRDTKERGRDLPSVIKQYTSLVKPAFEEFSLPTKKYADVIIPRGAENVVAVDLIVKHIRILFSSNMSTKLNPRTRCISDSQTTRPH